MSSREIVTLQFGTFANHVGCHFWNIEDTYRRNNEKNVELDPCIFFRQSESKTGKVETTPRTVIVDSQRGLGALDSLGNVYKKRNKVDRSQPPDVYSWDGRIKLCQTEEQPRNDFQSAYFKQLKLEEQSMSNTRKNQKVQEKAVEETKKSAETLDNSVKYWSDFSQLDFHKRSLYTLSYGDSLAQPFARFSYGSDLFSNYGKSEDWLDQVRFFAEECDNFQGFHTFTDVTDAFGGISSQLLRHLRDDYSSKPIMLFSLATHVPEIKKDTLANRQIRLNKFFCRNKFWDTVTSITPVNINNWNAKDFRLPVQYDRNFHTSAVIGSSLQTVTSPYRTRKNGSLKAALHGLVMRPSLKQNLLTTSFPLPQMENIFELPADIIDERNNRPVAQVHAGLSYGKFMTNLSYTLEKPDLSLAEGELRLISEWGVLRGTNLEGKAFENYVARGYPCFRRAGIHVKDGLNIPVPFPFKQQLTTEVISTCSSLYSDTKQHQQMEADLKQFQYLTQHHESVKVSQDLDVDEIREIKEFMINMADTYERP